MNQIKTLLLALSLVLLSAVGQANEGVDLNRDGEINKQDAIFAKACADNAVDSAINCELADIDKSGSVDMADYSTYYTLLNAGSGAHFSAKDPNLEIIRLCYGTISKIRPIRVLDCSRASTYYSSNEAQL